MKAIKVFTVVVGFTENVNTKDQNVIADYLNEQKEILFLEQTYVPSRGSRPMGILLITIISEK
ncbi:hypothetical protein ES705_17156 [subsurface metagenome]